MHHPITTHLTTLDAPQALLGFGLALSSPHPPRGSLNMVVGFFTLTAPPASRWRRRRDQDIRIILIHVHDHPDPLQFPSCVTWASSSAIRVFCRTITPLWNLKLQTQHLPFSTCCGSTRLWCGWRGICIRTTRPYRDSHGELLKTQTGLKCSGQTRRRTKAYGGLGLRH